MSWKLLKQSLITFLVLNLLKDLGFGCILILCSVCHSAGVTKKVSLTLDFMYLLYAYWNDWSCRMTSNHFSRWILHSYESCHHKFITSNLRVWSNPWCFISICTYNWGKRSYFCDLILMQINFAITIFLQHPRDFVFEILLFSLLVFTFMSWRNTAARRQ